MYGQKCSTVPFWDIFGLLKQAGQYFSQGNNILELYILVEIASPKVKRYLNTKVENFL